MSFGTGIFLAALGISGAKEAKRKHENKQYIRYLPNGVPYYMHHGSFYLYSGEKFVWFGDKAETLDGRVIYDKEPEYKVVKEKETNEKIIKYKEKGFLFYEDWIDRCSKPVRIEIKTGKPIAKIQRKKMSDGTYECRKWYWYDINGASYSKELLKSCAKTSDPNFIKPGDQGIVISENEFEKLCNIKGYNSKRYYYDEKC
jgi:hypothetical protein